MFGLFDGFGFTADLGVLTLPASALARMQISFAVGAILVVAFLASTIIAVAGFFRFRGYARWPVAADLTTALLCALGTFWFIGRLYVA
jgi:hypothetical protein